jgi:TetR/AcrR family transcriptional repressor of mexJK operon
MARKGRKAVSRGGRPSRADALLLRDRILGVATQQFLAEGYGSTTIEAIAARAGVSKRTLYDRFDDKAKLFAAVVHRIIAQIRPPADVPLLAGATLPDVLCRLAGLILNAALSAPALALHRLVNAESARFPELVRAVSSDGSTREGTALIADLLARELPTAKLSALDRAFAAELFLHMVVTLPQRRAMGFGTPMSPAELDAWANQVVNLFLNGCRHLRA